MQSTIHAPTNGAASELAAGLTDLGLEVLRRAGVVGDSVEMELELWRALANGLERESHWHRSRLFPPETSPGTVLGHVVHKAALEVASSFAVARDTAELDRRIRPWIGNVSVSANLRRLFGKVFTANVDGSPQPLGRSGIVRKLRVTALN